MNHGARGGLATILSDGDQVHITINSFGTSGQFWNVGNAKENAITLLHELAHAFNELKGAGGFELPDAADEKDPNVFDNEIKKKCF
jgi:hypothetical protein